MWRLAASGIAFCALLRTNSWGTQWGQLNQSPAALVPCVLLMWAIGVALATSSFVLSTSPGGLCLRFGV